MSELNLTEPFARSLISFQTEASHELSKRDRDLPDTALHHQPPEGNSDFLIYNSNKNLPVFSVLGSPTYTVRDQG